MGTKIVTVYSYPKNINNGKYIKKQKGAHASATIYSIIETVKANNLIAKRYLSYLFDKMTGINDFSIYIFDAYNLSN